MAVMRRFRARGEKNKENEWIEREPPLAGLRSCPLSHYPGFNSIKSG